MSVAKQSWCYNKKWGASSQAATALAARPSAAAATAAARRCVKVVCQQQRGQRQQQQQQRGVRAQAAATEVRWHAQLQLAGAHLPSFRLGLPSRTRLPHPLQHPHRTRTQPQH